MSSSPTQTNQPRTPISSAIRLISSIVGGDHCPHPRNVVDGPLAADEPERESKDEDTGEKDRSVPRRTVSMSHINASMMTAIVDPMMSAM